LATHKEAYVTLTALRDMLRALNSRNAVDSPPDIQQLQLASPASGDGDKKSDWPTSFDTSTMGGSVPGNYISSAVVGYLSVLFSTNFVRRQAG
jgi:hypothetical protein